MNEPINFPRRTFSSVCWFIDFFYNIRHSFASSYMANFVVKGECLIDAAAQMLHKILVKGQISRSRYVVYKNITHLKYLQTYFI
jgi:hypothetical protein